MAKPTAEEVEAKWKAWRNDPASIAEREAESARVREVKARFPLKGVATLQPMPESDVSRERFAEYRAKSLLPMMAKVLDETEFDADGNMIRRSK